MNKNAVIEVYFYGLNIRYIKEIKDENVRILASYEKHDQNKIHEFMLHLEKYYVINKYWMHESYL
jgi:hypothetical protein